MNETIVLKKGKEYLIYIGKCFASSYPIVQLYKNYNPIFICAETSIDAPKENFISLQEEFETQNLSKNWGNFAKILLKNKKIKELFKDLKKHQKEVWVKLFKNNLAFKSLFDEYKFKCLGLSCEQSNRWNDKIYQYEQLDTVVPIAKYIITTKENAIKNFNKLNISNTGVFTHLPTGGQGDGAKIHPDKESLKKYLNQINDNKFLMIEFLSFKTSPSIDILIANENEIFIYGLSDQILDKVVCLGAMYPSSLSQKIKQKCYEVAYSVGKKLANEGIRGIVGIDLIIDNDENVYFCELNARYTGVTHNRMLTMELSKPTNSPSMIDFEVMAIKEGTFKGQKLWDEPKEIFWYKKEIYSRIDGIVKKISINNNLRNIYDIRHGYAIVGQIKEGKEIIKHKTSLGNLVCVEKTKQKLNKLIIDSNKMIERYIGN